MKGVIELPLVAFMALVALAGIKAVPPIVHGTARVSRRAYRLVVPVNSVVKDQVVIPNQVLQQALQNSMPLTQRNVATEGGTMQADSPVACVLQPATATERFGNTLLCYRDGKIVGKITNPGPK
jgi:hypothetical protein